MHIALKLASYTALLFASIGVAAVATTIGNEQPKELGEVAWLRSYEKGLSVVNETQRPMLLLFQEIPGCQTCVDFGEAPLSHPLLVEVAETEFVPVAIYNNRPGIDQTIREQFDEPAWNFPVMRFVDQTGKDVIPRKDRVWETGDVANRMIEALDAVDRKVPKYLQLVASEFNVKETETATFAMFCFWEGEAVLGSLEGVLATEAAWLDGHEVVEVEFDPDVISYDALLSHASKMKCATKVYARTDAQLKVAIDVVADDAVRTDEDVKPAKPSDQQYHLKRAGLEYLPLIKTQRTRVNAAIQQREDVEQWLSPRQWQLAAKLTGLLREQPTALAGFEAMREDESLAEYTKRLMDLIESKAIN